MSNAGSYFKMGKAIFGSLEEGKPHSSITDWIEILSSDKYDELSLDGIPELVESVNIQGHVGTTEAARAIRKKLKYGNVHRQLRALVILRALTENANHGFQLHWANQELLKRLKDMATDSLLDPKVKKRLILVFHAWSIQYQDEPRMQAVANLYKTYHSHGGPPSRKSSALPATSGPSSTAAAAHHASAQVKRGPEGGFSDYNDIFQHDWNPAPGKRGPDTYADLAAAKADAELRKREREERIAIEQREAELERRERELKRKQDMAAIEARRQKDAAEEAERRRKAKEELKHKKKAPARPKFDFQREKPQIMVAVATAIQSANNLVNSCRLINREEENVTENPKVQDNLDKAKIARRAVVRYIQLVTDEEYVGTLLDANEKIVEAIQLYDKLSKPAVLDSDSDSDADLPPATTTPAAKSSRDVDALSKKMAAQKLEADRTGELKQLQDQQKRESARRAARATRQSTSAGHPDLEGLDFGSIRSQSSGLPAPLSPDAHRRDSLDGGSLSDYSDYLYDSSDDEWRAGHQGRVSRRGSQSAGARSRTNAYTQFDEDAGSRGLLDPNDPFGDPFADGDETPHVEKRRMEWAEI